MPSVQRSRHRWAVMLAGGAGIDDAKDPSIGATHSDEPALVRFTGLITDTPDPDQADRMEAF
jgi:hypothetical protein